jgi:hypothetical protein
MKAILEKLWSFLSSIVPEGCEDALGFHACARCIKRSVSCWRDDRPSTSF